MTLLLVRHGESEGNRDRVVQGWHDSPLTELGRRQADLAARRLAGDGIAAIHSSPLRRARETADAVAARTGLEVAELPDLREYDFGEAQGLTWDEMRARFRVRGRDWGRGAIPGEEGMPAFRARVSAAIGALLERHADETAAVVLHGGVIGAVAAWVFGLGDDEFAQIFTANCGVTELGAGPDGRPLLRSLNEVCHLSAAGGAPRESWLAG